MILKNEHWLDIFKIINDYFYQLYFKPILELLDNKLYNANNVIISALRSGQITYADGEFKGKFNIKISKELSAYCKFDARSKSWKGNPPPEIKAEAIRIQSKIKQLHANIQSHLDGIEIKPIDFTIMAGQAFDKIEGEIKTVLVNLGVVPDFTAQMKENIIKQYNENQNLNIKNWNVEQIQRLRDMVTKNALEGYNKKQLQQQIVNEMDVSESKAKFLSRQEGSLFMSTVRDSRYEDSGIKVAQWQTSHDASVRDTHKVLNGKYIKLSDSTVYADTLDEAKNNQWKSRANLGAVEKPAGVDFQCRCVHRPCLI